MPDKNFSSEQRTKLHLAQIGAELTNLSEAQAEYINVPLEGLYKADTYRY